MPCSLAAVHQHTAAHGQSFEHALARRVYVAPSLDVFNGRETPHRVVQRNTVIYTACTSPCSAVCIKHGDIYGVYITVFRRLYQLCHTVANGEHTWQSVTAALHCTPRVKIYYAQTSWVLQTSILSTSASLTTTTSFFCVYCIPLHGVLSL